LCVISFQFGYKLFGKFREKKTEKGIKESSMQHKHNIIKKYHASVKL